MWSVSTILTGLYSFMIETAPTLGSIETTTSQKRQFARDSLEYNCRNPTFRKLFPEYAELYKTQFEERQVALGITGSEPMYGTLSSMDQNATANGEVDSQGFFTAAAGIVALLSALVFAMRFI
jgi:ubiquitin-conjugating enzyme E2 J2